MSEPETNNRPVHTIRLGVVAVAIWKNQTDVGERFTLTLTQSYKAGDEWRSTRSIGCEFGYSAARAIELATDWMFDHSRSSEN